MKTKTDSGRRRHKLTENLSYKLIALVMALFLWFVVNDPLQTVDNAFGETFRIFQTDKQE